MTVRIVTDSSAGLPAALAERFGITVVGLHLTQTEKDHGTAGLGALELVAAYARQLERGGDDGVVAIHLSKELSATWSQAVTAAAVFDDQVRVADTNSTGFCLGFAAIAAARAASEGADLEACYEVASDVLERTELLLYVHKVDELRKSGRLSPGTALMSTALAARPIFHLRDGKLEVAVKTRTVTKAHAKLVELIQAAGLSGVEAVVIQQYEARETARHLQEQLNTVIPGEVPVAILDLDPVLARHTGPGSVAISVLGKLPERIDVDWGEFLP